MKKIWIVEDEEMIRELIVSALKDEGLNIKTFPDSAAAKEELKKELPPDILLTDYTMPGENGIELAKYFRDGFPETTVVLMSGNLELISKERIKNAGIKKTLRKPFQLSELYEVIEILTP
ncbi:MAG: response regulator [Patescibacteria group bacterium]